MKLLDRAKSAAEQAAVKAKEGVEEIQARRELHLAYVELGRAAFALVEDEAIGHAELERPVDRVRAARARLAEHGVDETEEASEVSVATPARTAAHPPQNPSTPIEGAERRIPSTTGKLSESTLKELLLAQEQEQQSTPGIGGAASAVKV